MFKLVLFSLLFATTAIAQDYCANTYSANKSVYTEAGKIIIGAVVSEVISRTVDRVIAQPSPTPRPPQRREPIEPSHGADPRPEPCPAAGQ